MNALLALMAAPCVLANEARFEIPMTLSAGSYVSWSERMRVSGGGRAVAYPYLRLGKGFYLGGALQAHTRPFFQEQLTTQGYGMRGDVLQAYVGWAKYWGRNMMHLKAGMLSSAFGSFLLRYDDAVNPLLDMPLGYGYYYKSVSTLGLLGAQMDVALGRVDGRVQFVTSSAANRRGLWDRDQYGQWAGGVGVTVRQGIRAGASMYRGPYLHRQHRFFYPGEAAPVTLPATGYGVDVQVAHGHFSFHGEVGRFQRAYLVIPTLNQVVAYGELKYTLSPRVFVATRIGRERWNVGYIPGRDVYDFAVGYRINRRQVVKFGYQVAGGPGDLVGVQLVTQISPM